MKKSTKSNAEGNALNTVGLQQQGNAESKKPGGCTGRGFMPGRSGNPSGKRKGEVSLTAALKRLLSKGENVDKVAAGMVLAAAKGDAAMAKALLDRIDGPVLKQFEGSIAAQLSGTITGPMVAPTQVMIVIPDNGRSAPAPAIDIASISKPTPALPAPVLVETTPEPQPVGAPKSEKRQAPKTAKGPSSWVSTWAEKSDAINGPLSQPQSEPEPEPKPEPPQRFPAYRPLGPL